MEKILHSHSFNRSERILKRTEFIRLSRAGQKIQSEYFIALFEVGRTDKTRLGITVTKKVGGAVIRNRIKRLVREYFRLNKNSINGNWDINIIAKRKAAIVSSNHAFFSLKSVFNTLSRKIDG